MEIVLLNNKIPLYNESKFEINSYESPGWNSTMSKDNRSLNPISSIRLSNLTFQISRSGWSYRKPWVKILKEKETIDK